MSRWIPTLAMMLVSLISYIDRNTLALLAPTILRETGMSAQQYGWVISSFSVMYTLGNPVWGRLLDRVGVRGGMRVAVGFWTAASMAHAWASGFAGFALARALLGFGEGATFPGGLRTVVQTLPESSRGRGTALAYSGGSLGALLTPLLVTPVAERFGWRGAFLFTGLVGVAWLALWELVSRRPAVAARPVLMAAQGPRWRDRRVWAYMSAYGLGGVPIAFVLYGAALYLGQARGASQGWIGRVLWVPPLGWELGWFFWGWLTDRVVRESGDLRRWLLLPTVLSLPIASVPWLEPRWLVLAAMAFAMFVAAGFLVMAVAYATKEFGTTHAGLLAGLGAGSWSAVVACVMPGLGALFDRGLYGPAFVVAATVPLLGYAGWRLFSRP